MKKPYIDHSVYPDRVSDDELIEDFADDYARADYVERICSAWDFDIRPEPATVALFEGWRDVFDRFPLPHSPAYHAFRTWFRWPPVPREGGSFYVPTYLKLDRLEGRTDPCEGMV